MEESRERMEQWRGRHEVEQLGVYTSGKKLVKSRSGFRD